MDAESLPYALDLVAGSGVILSPERRAALRTSLQLVRRDYRFEQVRLWGRIQGIRGAYYIAEGLGPDRMGTRSRLYSLNCVDWSLLPVPTEEMTVSTAPLKGRFQGDPSYEYENLEKREELGKPYEEEAGLVKICKIYGDPCTEKIPVLEDGKKISSADVEGILETLVKEEVRLVATIDEIDKAVGIVPRGAYVKTPVGPVHENRSFEGLSLTEAKKLSSYFHFTEPEKLKNKTLLEKADLDPAIDFLDSLEHDVPKGSWSIQVERGGRVVVLRSLLWLGLTFYHIPNTKQHGYIYFGTGEKNIDLPFML